MSKKQQIIQLIKEFKSIPKMVRDETDPFDFIMSDKDIEDWNKRTIDDEALMRDTAKEYNIDYDSV